MIPYIISYRGSHILSYMNACSTNPFSLDTLSKSFADPRSDLFVRSLKAELKRKPSLKTVTIEQVELDRPDALFGDKRKGYYKCDALSRVQLLKIFAKSRIRGEFFARWHNPRTGKP